MFVCLIMQHNITLQCDAIRLEHIFCGDVVWSNFNKTFRDEDNILERTH